jgi:hypothetical protein
MNDIDRALLYVVLCLFTGAASAIMADRLGAPPRLSLVTGGAAVAALLVVWNWNLAGAVLFSSVLFIVLEAIY